MGEEGKKPEEKKMEEKKPAEEVKMAEEGKQGKKEEEKKVEKPADEKKEEKKAEESKQGTEATPPPPPQEIVLKVYMHCEGCARKVRRSLKGFDGVEAVEADCRTHKVVVKGEKADPLKVLERVQRKSHRQVELLYPIPKPPPPPEEEKKPELKEEPNPPEKKEEPKVITATLKVRMHCEACAQKMKKRILRMKGVESAEPDLRSSQVAVTGVFEPSKLVEYVYRGTGKQGVIVKQEPEEKKEEETAKEGANKEEKKKGEEGGGDKKGEGDDGAKEKKGGDGAGKPPESTENATADTTAFELKKNEYLYCPPDYPPRFVPPEYYGNGLQYQYQYQYQYQPQYQYQYQYQPAAAYPSQIFSDENPNACSIM